MRFWQAIAWAETEQVCEIAETAESLGFEGIMSADHALYPAGLSGGYPYSDDGKPPLDENSDYPDVWAITAAMASRTSRLKFFCGVYVLPLREPLEIAKHASTLANLSQGRFIMGVGSGWMKEEFDIYGVNFKTRGARMDEMLEVLNGVWKDDWFEYHGKFFDFPKIKLSPPPRHEIPFFFGGDKPRALKRAARLGDGWINTGNTPDEIEPLVKRIHSMRQEAGVSDKPFEIICGVYAKPEVDLYRRLEDVGVTGIMSLPFAMELGKRSALNDKKRMMERYERNIMRHFKT
jgi:probable F420-dependent oxidoreductase